MDLIGAIFDDKRTSKSRSSGKNRDKNGTQGVKKKKPTKSDATDKRPKTIPRNANVFNGEKHDDNKNAVYKMSIEKNSKGENGLKKNDSTKHLNTIKKNCKNVLTKEKALPKEQMTTDSNLVRNVSRNSNKDNVQTRFKNPLEHSDDNSLENAFETALEIYSENVFDEKDADFGRESFSSLDKDYFVEAYNKEGSELVETRIELSFNELCDDSKDYRSSNRSSEPVTYDKLILISDDEESVYCECFNSQRYQLKVRMRDKISSESEDQKCKDLTEESTNDYNKSENIIKRELINRDSLEGETFEEKSIQELVKATNASFIGNRGSVARSSSGASSKSEWCFNPVSRNNSTSSRSSYSAGFYENTEKEEDFPKLQLSFEVKTKTDMIIQELLETEYTYIENLTIIKKDYINYFKRIRIDASSMFGNIEEILKESKNFYRSLHYCGNNCEYIAKTIEDYHYLFKLYPQYSLNKRKADHLVQKRFKPILLERQKTLGHKLDLASYLLNPVQRLGRYILLLQNLQKSIRKPEYLDNAVKLVENAMKRGNDYVAIASIKFADPGRNPFQILGTKGSYINREKFMLLKPKREEIVLFLFEKIVVFTTQIQNSETFAYKSSIDLDDLQIIHSEGDNQVFQLKNYTKSKRSNEELSYTLEGRSDKLTETWVQLIQNKLWEQLQQVKALSKTYKVPDVGEHKKIHSFISLKNGNKGDVNQPKKGRTSSDRNTVKGNTRFYTDEDLNGYETL